MVDYLKLRIRLDVAKSLGWRKQGRFWVPPDERISYAAEWDIHGIPHWMEDWTTNVIAATTLLLKMPEGRCFYIPEKNLWVASYSNNYVSYPDNCIATCLAWLNYCDNLN